MSSCPARKCHHKSLVLSLAFDMVRHSLAICDEMTPAPVLVIVCVTHIEMKQDFTWNNI